MIPGRLIRSVPAATSSLVEDWWAKACGMHPGWEHVTFRDPIDPDEFPITSPYWGRCRNGAQLAGLVRLEALWWGGGFWLDSDVELWRSLEPLRACKAFAGWEDPGVVPDAVLGAEPQHTAILDCLDLAIARITSDEEDWRTGNGAWATGPGVTTTVLPGRPDVLLLPPGSFYPVHYSARAKTHRADPADHPWAFGIHHWHASWLEGDHR